jgi:hypothetical protein
MGHPAPAALDVRCGFFPRSQIETWGHPFFVRIDESQDLGHPPQRMRKVRGTWHLHSLRSNPESCRLHLCRRPSKMAWAYRTNQHEFPLNCASGQEQIATKNEEVQ